VQQHKNEYQQNNINHSDQKSKSLIWAGRSFS